MALTWNIQSPAGGAGAVSIVTLAADDAAQLDGALARLGVGPLTPGSVSLRPIAGLDRGLVARWSAVSASLMPHASPAVLRQLAPILAAIGAHRPDPRRDYPEAGSILEAHTLAAIARAASPRAIDLLVDQPRRWAAYGASPRAGSLPEPIARDLDRVRNRLIDPPLVAAWGPPNVGKSTLVNALAGRDVSIVADEPGTTRDHVGVLLDMAGLVVRYADTPGLRAGTPSPVEAEGLALARDLVAGADLLLLVGDATARPPPPPSTGRPGLDGPTTITVATRVDLGAPGWPFDVGVCARDGRGLDELVAMVGERLVPRSATDDPRPWAFWPSPGVPPP